jgi:hypothetical protein
MVVAKDQIEFFVGRAHPDRCSKRQRGRITRCVLEPGHPGHHLTYVTVRRVNGETAGYTRYWLEP